MTLRRIPQGVLVTLEEYSDDALAPLVDGDPLRDMVGLRVCETDKVELTVATLVGVGFEGESELSTLAELLLDELTGVDIELEPTFVNELLRERL